MPTSRSFHNRSSLLSKIRSQGHPHNPHVNNREVNKMCRLFSENRADCKEREVLRHVRDYNKRYSGAPRQVKDYLCDTPLFLLLLVRWLGNMSGLVWLFLLRVAVCGFGAAMSLASPLETLPGPLNSVLGTLDDFVVVFLLLICIININQQMGQQRTGTHTVTQGVLTDTL
ncbi:E3 ubiquitin-protein ligase RNF170 [Anabarilius grahami]|uniref:E3 ubiquitin-protein ligase RNF170 n=1 Tax=Anabarilius grahami TaxID=495550 RepID=A0A3N0YYB4_ANAGA|nr:E3 ubiquitin-protein ligase RNF170 [Anabarilius grahami]